MAKPVTTIVLRGLSVVSYMVAAIVMFASSQTVYVNSYEFIARYTDWSGLVFFAIINCVGFVYNFGVLFFPSGSPLWKTIIVFDVIVNIIVGASLGAGWQICWLILSGNIHTGWVPICRTVPFFCSKVLGAVCTSTVGFLISFWLLMCTLRVSVDPFLLG